MTNTLESLRSNDTLEAQPPIVGTVLIVLTVASFWIGVGHSLGGSTTTLVVAAVGFVKAWLVAYHFMDVRNATRALQIVVNVWFLITAAVILGILAAV